MVLTSFLVLWWTHDVAADEASSLKQSGHTTLFLTAQEPDMSKEPRNAKLLIRELARQAVLMAARDQLGLSTRDMTLRETMPENVEDRLDLQVAASKESVQVVISRGEARFFEREFELKSIPVFNYGGFAAALEELIAGDLAEALKKAGFQGRPNVIKSSVEVPAEIENRLREMNFLSQYSALRQLHALQRSDGESVQTLAALVRGYSNLAQLTSFHWNASHKAFKARSLLYAQRLVRLDKNSAWSLRHRAYAEALTGLHAAALEDLRAARESAGSTDQPMTAAPVWEKLVDAVCRYDGKTAAGNSDADTRELAALVSMMIVENSQIMPQLLTAGRHTLEVVPECYWACDAMARTSGVSNQHVVTVIGPETLERTLAVRLREIPGLPDAVLGVLDNPPGLGIVGGDPAWAGGSQRIALIQALISSAAAGKDSNEPSWETLGRLLEDVTFVHVYRRIAFFVSGLALPPASYQEELQAALAVIANHPYRAFVECLPLDINGDADRIQTLLGQTPIIDADLFAHKEVLRYWKVGSAPDKLIGPPIWEAILIHNDDIAQDFERLGALSPVPVYPRRLRIVSPYSPLAIALLIARDATIGLPKMKEWEQEFGDNANVLAALAGRYSQLRRMADAERCLLRYAGQTPDGTVYGALAKLYKEAGQLDKWREAIEETLKYEDFGLAHARSRVSIAEYLRELGQLKEALAYAEEAAETGASWALQCAAECHEMLEQWNESEQFVRIDAERYQSAQFNWYFWCRRTEHGNLAAAQKMAVRRASALTKGNTPTNRLELGVYYILVGTNPPALNLFRNACKTTGDIFSGLHWILLSDEAHDEAEREAAFREILDRVAKTPNPPPAYAAHAAFAKWLNDEYAQSDDHEPDVESLEGILKPLQKDNLANFAYFAGRFFQLRGKSELAKKYYVRCLDSHQMNRWNFTLAAVRLRDLKKDEAKSVR
jgi:tetratricopeptide (TPR) repeat protein